MQRKDFSGDDRVVLAKTYTLNGEAAAFLVPELGVEGTVLGKWLDVPYNPNSIVVRWNRWDNPNGTWVDLDCIVLATPTEEELAEVYKILGVSNQTEEV